MKTIVGLYGNPMLQAKNLARIIDTEDDLGLGDLLALTRGCVIAVEESTTEPNYKVEVTLSFEGTGRQFYVMNHINNILEDIIELNEHNGSFSMNDIVEEICNMSTDKNPYLNKLVRRVKRLKGESDQFDIMRDEDGRISLSYLYTYQQDHSDIVEIYNMMFIALKYNIIKQIEHKLTQVCHAEVDCRNNCLTVAFNLDPTEIYIVLSEVFALVNSDDLIAKCLSNINITVPSERDIIFALPNMPDNEPEYTNALYDCDYIIYCESEKSLEVNRAKFMTDLESRMALAPDTRVDYILVQDDTNDDALIAKSLSNVSNVPTIKTLVGAIDDNIEWMPEPGTHEHIPSKNSFFNHATDDEGDDLVGEKDTIRFSNHTDSKSGERRVIDFNGLKQELTKVGLSGFKGLKVFSWEDQSAPLSIDILKADEVKTGILDDYDVAKITVKDKEVLMHYMKSFDLKSIPIEYIEKHVKAEHLILSEHEISSISNNFTAHNVSAIESVLANTKEKLMKYYAKQPEQSIRDSYIKIVLSDICDEFYSALRQSIMDQNFDYNIDDTKPNAYVSANFKIILLKTLYDQITTNSREYWLRGVDETLKDPDQPNFPIISKLLDELL